MGHSYPVLGLAPSGDFLSRRATFFEFHRGCAERIYPLCIQ